MIDAPPNPRGSKAYQLMDNTRPRWMPTVLNNGLSCLEIWGDSIVGGSAQILTALSNCRKIRNFVNNQHFLDILRKWLLMVCSNGMPRSRSEDGQGGSSEINARLQGRQHCVPQIVHPSALSRIDPYLILLSRSRRVRMPVQRHLHNLRVSYQNSSLLEEAGASYRIFAW